MFQRDIREDLDAFADSHNAALGKFNKVTKAAKVEKKDANRPSIANYNAEPSRSILKKDGSPKRSKKQLTHSSTITMPYASRESVASPIEGRGTVGALEDLGVRKNFKRNQVRNRKILKSLFESRNQILHQICFRLIHLAC